MKPVRWGVLGVANIFIMLVLDALFKSEQSGAREHVNEKSDTKGKAL